MFKKILVPLDGSETAELVLPFVQEEARLHGAEVLLLRVIAPLRRSLMSIPSVMDHVYKQVDAIAAEYLEGISKKLEAEGLHVECHIERGRPAERIVQVARDHGCDLIIIGSHGESSSMQWRFGSVANKVVKTNLFIPVMLVTT
jgi:nucleotide-binding universal stress UspA family protein